MNFLQRLFQGFKSSASATYRPWSGLSSAARSHQGGVRKKNEDALLSRPDLALWVVADGMGGHLAGDYASQCVVSFVDQITPDLLKQHGLAVVKNALWQADQAIRHYAQAELGGKTVGSTVCVLLLEKNTVHCLWVGDSRIYRYRQGQFVALTRDHTQAIQLLEQGLIPESEVDTHPASHVLTRAMGCNVFDLAYAKFDLKVGDRFLLCSDGLYGELSAEEIGRVLAHSPADACVEHLLQQVLERGARDNVSIICVDTAS